MDAHKQHIISQLQKDILLLQGYKTLARGGSLQSGLGPIEAAFPNKVFPVGAVHEFITETPEDGSATAGFISGLLSSLMQNKGVSLWISSNRMIFPPGLMAFGINPSQVIFIDLHQYKDVLWAIEEGLKCNGLSAVIGELPELSFTASRRLQLAVEQSRVTGFILRPERSKQNTTGCVARWKIKSIPSLSDDLPGPGFPRWNVDLLKVRNGVPRTWQVEWINNKFRPIDEVRAPMPEQIRKIG